MTFKLLILLTILATVLSLLDCLEKGRPGDWKIVSQAQHLHAPSFLVAHFFDEKNGIGLTPLYLQTTNDGGSSWKILELPSEMGFSSMIFADSDTGWVVGTAETRTNDGERSAREGAILRTGDRGKTWLSIRLGGKNGESVQSRFTWFTSICIGKDEHFLLAGDRGIVEVVFAKGKLDVVSLHETPVAITSISCDASGDVWGVGENGWVVHRRDRVWSATQFDSDISFKKVFVNSKAVWILGLSRPSEIESGEFLQIQGILFRSIDQGASWQEKTPASANGLSDMIFFGDQGLLVGLKGAIYSSRDGGDTWNSVKSPTTNDLYSVCGINQREFIILGDSLTVLRHK